MQDYEKLSVWVDAMDLTSTVYVLSQRFPPAERFGLTSQIRRAAVSIAANIAEGSSRSSAADFARFLEIAIGSANEVHCLARIATNLRYCGEQEVAPLIDDTRSLRARLIRLMQSVRTRWRDPT